MKLLARIGENSLSLLVGLIILWFLLKYAQRAPQPIGGWFTSAQRLATPGGV